MMLENFLTYLNRVKQNVCISEMWKMKTACIMK